MLSGTLSGDYLTTAEDNRPADGTLPVSVNATGNIRGLGRVSITGALDFGGFRPAGAPDIVGTITLANAKGSLTLRLSGNGGQGAISGRSFALNASIISGTGSYANVRGVGTTALRLGVNTILCVSSPCPIGGKLSLSLSLRAPIR